MPIASYEIDGYVKDALERIGIKESKLVKEYIEVIQNSIGCNPRTMKRTFNAYLLLTKVTVDNRNRTDFENLLLFALLCMQLSFEELYNYIVVNAIQKSEATIINRQFFEDIRDDNLEDEKYVDLMKVVNDENSDYDADMLISFLQTLSRICLNNSDKKTDIAESLKNCLLMTTVTNTTNKRAVKNMGIRGSRGTSPLQALVDCDEIKEGSTLVLKRNDVSVYGVIEKNESSNQMCITILDENRKPYTDDNGKPLQYTSPSTAANESVYCYRKAHAVGNEAISRPSINGWNVWEVEDTYKLLAECRASATENKQA